MKTRETLLRFISRAVAKPNGTTAHHIKKTLKVKTEGKLIVRGGSNAATSPTQ
jgi:ribosome-binding protein aMBF1 (putative translation factor)